MEAGPGLKPFRNRVAIIDRAVLTHSTSYFEIWLYFDNLRLICILNELKIRVLLLKMLSFLQIGLSIAIYTEVTRKEWFKMEICFLLSKRLPQMV